MSASRNRWLLEQLPLWEGEGLLTAEAARTLRARHAVEAAGPGLGQIMMGALGALLLGSGLIAVIGHNWDEFSRPARRRSSECSSKIGHNWDEFSRPARLLFAFLPLLLAQLFSWRVLRHGAAAAWVRETAGLLQALTAGACIALVSQIYNLGGEWTDFLFWWFMLSLPLAWVLMADSVVVFYAAATAVWAVSRNETGIPWHDSPLIYPLLLLALLPRWWGRPAPSALMRWILALSAVTGLCSAAAFAVGRGGFFSSSFSAVVLLWSFTAACLVLLPLNARGIAESAARKPQVVLGCLWLFGYGLGATFPDACGELLEGMGKALAAPWGQGLLAVLAVFAVLALIQGRWAVLAIASVVVLPLLARLPRAQAEGAGGTLLSGLFTAHLAIIGLTLILLDFAGKRAAPRLGAALLSVLVLARMADSHFSLLAKGLAFMGVGAAFLAFNFFMSRRARRQREGAA